MSNCQIESIDALTCITKYDGADTFFYVDPPYVDAHQGHYAGYTAEMFVQLLEVLQAVQGQFCLSHYWNDYLRQYVGVNNWHVKEIVASSSAKNSKYNTGADRHRIELLITNYDPSTITPHQGNASLFQLNHGKL